MKPLLHLLSSFTSLVCLGLGATAQDQATTLLANSQRAEVVVLATVVAASDPSPEWHRLEFRTDELLKGRSGADFAVLEPAGACCGRSLFALQPGAACLLFLQRRGATLHPLGGSRGVLAADPELTAHVRALLAAPDAAATAALLAGGLQSPLPRIADDAAHALAGLPTLALDRSRRAAVAEALGHAVRTRLATAASLVEVAVRIADAPMLDTLLPLYLDQERADQASLLREGLARCAADELLARLPMHLRNDEAGELRAAELLGRLPAEHGGPALRRLLTTTHSPRVQLRVTETLLDQGAATSTLPTQLPAPVLRLAERRRHTAQPFRSIQPASR